MTIKSASSAWSLISWSSPLSRRKRRKSSTDPPRATFPKNAGEINKTDSKGRSLLYYAARYDQADVAIQLLAAGCDPNLSDRDGNTPLHEATENGHIDVIRLLVKGGECDLNAKNKDGQSALMRAVLNDDIDIVKLLMKSGARVNDLDHMNRSSLLIGLRQGSERSCMHLLKNGCDVNGVDKEGHSALFYAAHSPRISTLVLAKRIAKSGYCVMKDKRWLIEVQSNEEHIIHQDKKFLKLLMSKLEAGSNGHWKSDPIRILKMTFLSSLTVCSAT